MTPDLSRIALRLLLAGMLLFSSMPVAAQNINLVDYTRGRGHFPNLFGPYAPQAAPLVTYQDSVRLEDLIREGTLYLSLQDAIYLAMENNLDIAVQRFGPAIAHTDLLSAKGGGVARGAAGTGGVTSLGGGPTGLDPTISSNLTLRHATFPQANTVTSGVSSLSNNFGTANFTYSQGFVTGTTLQITSTNQRQTTNSLFDSLNPQINTGLQIIVSQPLLNGFGFAQNLRFIRVAKNNIQISDHQFAQQVMDIVSTVKRSYWELVFSRENTNVAQQSLALAEKLYQDNQRQVEIGTLAPLEVVRAEAEVARTRQQLIVAQTGLLQQQIVLKDLVSKNPGDPLLATVTIEPINQPEVPTTTEVIPIQDALQIALAKRPEVASQQMNMKNLALQTKATRKSLLPSVNIFASWTSRGLAGNSPIFERDANGNPVLDPSGNPIVIGIAEAGLSRSLTQTIQGDSPDYQFGFQISIPLRNRQAQAQMARAQIEERRAEIQYRRLVNTVILNVRNAQIALQQSRSQIDAAIKARELAEQTLNAEEKRFQLGATTIFQVIQTQRDLAQARSNEVRSLVDYQRALVDFDRALGRTLERSSITLQEAKTGLVTASSSPVRTPPRN